MTESMTPAPLASYVDPFLGVDGWGNCLCGPYLPFSLVRLGPDTVPWQMTNGYSTADPIVHFSHTHVSGTGGGSRYGNIGVVPFTGKPRTGLAPYDREDETASPGYYAVTLMPEGIRAELTTTPRVGVHRYTFPRGVQANILVDAGAVIRCWIGSDMSSSITTGENIGGYVEWISDHELVGRGDFRGGWGHAFPYSVYFYMHFDQPHRWRRVYNAQGEHDRYSAEGIGCKAVAEYGDTEVVTLQVGISYVSVAKARASVEREVGDADFDTIRQRAERTWEDALSRVRVDGGDETQRRIFYSLFTRLLCMPSDLGVDDEFPLWHSGVRHFTDYYCLWDSVRNANSLIALFAPEMEVAMLNCLLDVGAHTGWIPDAWVAGHSAFIQGGSSCDILLCEAALKGLKGIDYAAALRQIRKNNEVESPDPRFFGRYLAHYRDLGYVSTDTSHACVSRHLEYAYQDWCIGRLAEHLGETELAERQYASAGKVWNLWRDDLHVFAPRKPNGDWVMPFDPTTASAERWMDPNFYEGTSIQWSFNVQHDFAGLVARHGGTEAFIRHLDAFFAEGHYDSKETMLHIPYLYSYAGRPDLASARVRECVGKYFALRRDGLKDNEDMGCQSAFFMCSTMGLYPIMGQDLYLLVAPSFPRTEITLGESGKSLLIETPEAGTDKPFITAATLNGAPLNRAWIRHNEIADGAVLRFEVSDVPGAWGRDELPPTPMSR